MERALRGPHRLRHNPANPCVCDGRCCPGRDAARWNERSGDLIAFVTDDGAIRVCQMDRDVTDINSSVLSQICCLSFAVLLPLLQQKRCAIQTEIVLFVSPPPAPPSPPAHARPFAFSDEPKVCQ